MRRSPRSSTCEYAEAGASPSGASRTGRGGGQGLPRRPPVSHALVRLLARRPGGGQEPYLLITLGKGGTGKTTVAAALAAALAERGFSVLAASVDPAHNLGDVLGVELGPEPRAVDGAGRLRALEVDTRGALERFLARQAELLQGAYRYLRALNLDGYLDTLRYSPGIEEHATLEEMQRLLDLAGTLGCDALIIDTPPTGLTLRVLSLPAVSVRWADHLARLRRALLEHRYALEQVLGPQYARVGDAELYLATREETDAISRILKEYRQSMDALRRRLVEAGSCGVLVVKNPDRLSTLETERAMEGLAEFGIPVAMMVVNKARGERDALAEGGPYPARWIPELIPEPIGLEPLRRVAACLLEGSG